MTKSSVYLTSYHQRDAALKAPLEEENAEEILLTHQILKPKLQQLWCPGEHLTIIDLGLDFFIVKFQEKVNMEKALHGGPWFIMGHFLSVRNWEPNFVPEKSKIQSTAIWIRLPQLPTEFYNKEIQETIVCIGIW